MLYHIRNIIFWTIRYFLNFTNVSLRLFDYDVKLKLLKLKADGRRCNQAAYFLEQHGMWRNVNKMSCTSRVDRQKAVAVNIWARCGGDEGKGNCRATWASIYDALWLNSASKTSSGAAQRSGLIDATTPLDLPSAYKHRLRYLLYHVNSRTTVATSVQWWYFSLCIYMYFSSSFSFGFRLCQFYCWLLISDLFNNDDYIYTLAEFIDSVNVFAYKLF